MPNCANCGQQILFGGVSHGTLRFCNQKCYNAASHLRESLDMPDDELEAAVTAFHQGDCPCCGGPGPVDMHFSHRVMSFLVFTQFQTIPKISCRSCAAKAKLANFFLTLFIGWWGVPFGLILTPIYLCRNLFSLISPTAADAPSDQLREFIRLNLAQHNAILAAAEKAQEGDTPFADAG